ncbi:MAG: hypothetical protein Q8Q39_03325 [bacterium]|nr:hypothetical protein [bacterium]
MFRESGMHNSEEREMGEFVVAENSQEAARMISARFEDMQRGRYGKDGKEPKDFHNEEHPAEVAEGCLDIWDRLTAIDPELFPASDRPVIEALGRGHDLKQETKIKELGGVRRLVRARGFREKNRDALIAEGWSVGNEEAGAEEIIAEMRRYKKPDGTHIFPVEDENFLERVQLAVAATYPELPPTFVEKLPPEEGGAMGLKISQPYLNADSDPWALVLAIEDLRGPAGAGDFETFRKSGNAEFRELNPWVREAIAGGIEGVAENTRKAIAVEILKWKRSQEGFARWQRVLFGKALEENKAINASVQATEIKQVFRDRYSHFEDNIQRTKSTYEELLQKFGPPESLNEQATGDAGLRELLEAIGYEQ